MWNRKANGGVALLVDFENLVRGVERGGGEVDCAALAALAAAYGRVRVARAYADWRMADTGRHRERVSRAGIELVDVLARRGGALVKNAADMRMGVDAVELALTMRRVDVFVLATGDGDFVPVAQALRRRGKTVVGVCPHGAASAVLAAACDAFVDCGAPVDGGVGPWPRGADGTNRRGRPPGASMRALRRWLGRGRSAGVGAAVAVRRGDGPERTGTAARTGAGNAGERAGWSWIRWAREQLRSGAVAANGDGAWLHRIRDEALVVVPDCFEPLAAAQGVGPKTVKNRVLKLGRHRSRPSRGGRADLFHAALGDGRRVRGMLFPGELLWGGDAPVPGSARLLDRRR